MLIKQERLEYIILTILQSMHQKLPRLLCKRGKKFLTSMLVVSKTNSKSNQPLKNRCISLDLQQVMQIALRTQLSNQMFLGLRVQSKEHFQNKKIDMFYCYSGNHYIRKCFHLFTSKIPANLLCVKVVRMLIRCYSCTLAYYNLIEHYTLISKIRTIYGLVRGRLMKQSIVHI